MKRMGLEVCRYLISGNEMIEYHVYESRLVKYVPEPQILKLRRTMANLLYYLLQNCSKQIISDRSILMNVWEINGLCSSSQRLWQVMNNLKKILTNFGVKDEMIIRISGKGYHVISSNIQELYCKDTYLKEVYEHNYI